MMRAMALDQFGGPEVLHMVQLPVPQPGPGEVLIRTAFAGVNPADWKAREGWLSLYFAYQFPFVLGFDVSGIVAAVGASVTGLGVGDRVVAASNQGMGRNGSYADFTIADATRTVPLPDSISLLTAAAVPTAGMTAWLAVFDIGQARAGQKILVNGGAGGTGSFAVQFARMAGAQVAATSSPGNADYLRALGADCVIDYRNQDVTRAVLDWAPDGVDLVVDTVGQGALPQAVALTRPGGIVAPIGTLHADEPPHDEVLALQKQVSIIPTTSTFDDQGRQLRAIVEALSNGQVRAPDITTLPLAEAAEAHRRIQAGHVRGKIVLDVAGEDA